MADGSKTVGAAPGNGLFRARLRAFSALFRALTILFLLPAGGFSGCGRDDSPPTATIRGHTWRVIPAVTSRQRYQGMAGRTSVADDEGMLFIYPQAAARNYCMRNCLVPLDIAFIGPDLRVIAMHTMAVEPGLAGEKVYPSGAPAQYVLETTVGALARAGVKPGDTVTFSSNVPPAAKADPGP
ncbi:MAG TPA: hypothetical protein DCX07_06010 [Phycisphaerales bacterium]|nr:hypothetical protein [Phycisphaerales bacterium]